MNTQKIVLLVILLVGLSVPVHAQDDGCNIDLGATIVTLFNTQREADSGNAFGAVQNIEAVQAELAALVESCADVLFPLPQAFVAPDESIAFNYPAKWIFTNPQENIYIVTNSRNVVNALTEDTLDDVVAGEQALFAFVITQDIIDFADTTFAEAVDQLRNDLSPSYDRIGRPEMFEMNEQQAARLSIQEANTIGVFDFIDYLDAETPAIVLVGAISTTDDAELMQAMLAAFEDSLRFPANSSLRLPGVALDDLRYTSAIVLDDLDDQFDLRALQSATLSPDGSLIAYHNTQADTEQICLYTLATGATTCDALPERFDNRPVVLHWSPDSTRIAFTGDFIRSLREVDIWLYDVVNHQIVDATDDGVDRWNPFGGADEGETGPVWIDAVMTWGPDGNLYFMRSEFPEIDTRIDDSLYGLYRLDPDGGQPELVRDLTGFFGPFPIFYSQAFGLDGVMSVSPDAEQIAFLVRGNQSDDPNNGVWVMDLAGDTPPRQLVDYNTFFMGLPPDAVESGPPLTPSALTWNADGTQLFVLADNFMVRGDARSHAYAIDVETGQTVLLTDIGNPEPEAFFTPGEDGLTAGFPMPRAGVLAPDGTGLLILNLNAPPDVGGLSALRSVRGGGEQELLYRIDDFRLVPSLIATVAADGTVLMNGYLFTPG